MEEDYEKFIFRIDFYSYLFGNDLFDDIVPWKLGNTRR